MKSTSTNATVGNEGTASAVETSGQAFAMVRMAVKEVYCYATQSEGSEVYQGRYLTTELPWDDEEFVEKSIKIDFKGIVYRSEKAKAAIGLKAGEEVTMAQFVAGIKATSFRGEATPNKDDKDQADKWMKAIKAGSFTMEAVLAKVEKEYGWKVSGDHAGLVQHFFKKRMKESESDVSLDNV